MTPTAHLILRSLAVLGILGAPSAAPAQTGLFEVETSDATRLLRLQDDAGFVITGDPDTGVIPATGAGARLMWYPGKVAFRAGQVDGTQWDDENVGPGSVALGVLVRASGANSLATGVATNASGTTATAMGNSSAATGFGATAIGMASRADGDGATAMGIETVASGFFSTAIGAETVALGRASTALGSQTTAEGDFSTALNGGTKASGPYSLATGNTTIASGEHSTAMGQGTRAAGSASVAMGTSVVAAGDGSFVFGDRNIQFPMNALANQFQVRAFGGVLMNTGVNIGCVLKANEGAWSCTSSRLAKEAFEAVDGEEVLGKLAALPIQRWRYLGSDVEHMGPVAEDFHAAFGLGDSTTRIATVDADGIALRAIQALERRTAELRSELTVLRAENDSLRARMAAVEDRTTEF